MKRVLAALCLAAAACTSQNSSSTAPTSTTNVPDQSQYEALPAKHYLIDAGGKATHMWVQLEADLTPVRGSTVILGQQFCPGVSSCFQASITIGMDPIDNPASSAGFNAWFSPDNTSHTTAILQTGVPARPGGRTDHYGPWTFPYPVKYILVEGSHLQGFNDPAEAGSTSFFLDYR